MGRYSLFIKPSALKEIEALSRSDCGRVVRRIQALATDPRPPGVEKLAGQERYRVRQGAFRIIYLVSDGERSVRVVKVGHRREVYRRQES